MKKVFMLAVICFAVCNISARVIVSATANSVAVSSITQLNSGAVSYKTNPNIKAGELAYTVVRLTRSSSSASRRYSYILWTQSAVTSEQGKQIIDYIRAKASGNLAGITYDSTLLASGSSYTWYAGGGSRSTMSFSRQQFSQTDKNLASAIAYGAYTVSGAAQTTEAPTFPPPTVTTRPQTTAAPPATSTTVAATAPPIIIETVTSIPNAGETNPSITTTTERHTVENPTTMPPIVVEPATSLPNANATEPPTTERVTSQPATERPATEPSTTEKAEITIPHCGS